MESAIMSVAVVFSYPFFAAALAADSTIDAGKELTLGACVIGLAGFVVWLMKSHRQERDAMVQKLDEVHKESKESSEQFRSSVERMTTEHAAASLAGHEAAGSIRGEVRVLTEVIKQRLEELNAEAKQNQ